MAHKEDGFNFIIEYDDDFQKYYATVWNDERTLVWDSGSYFFPEGAKVAARRWIEKQKKQKKGQINE